MRVLALVAAALPIAACYAPIHDECAIACGAGGACPSGTSCRSGWCTTASGDPVCASAPDAPFADAEPADARADGAPPIDGVPDAPPADAIPCPAGYTGTFGGHRYRAAGGDDDWLPAQMDCADDGAGTHLAIPDSQAENDFLRTFGTAAFGDVKFWIGLTDRVTEGSFRTVVGDALGSYTYWDSGQPSGDDCVIIWRAEHAGRWNAIVCSDTLKQNYVCECDGRPSDTSAY